MYKSSLGVDVTFNKGNEAGALGAKGTNRLDPIIDGYESGNGTRRAFVCSRRVTFGGRSVVRPVDGCVARPRYHTLLRPVTGAAHALKVEFAYDDRGTAPARGPVS